MAHRACTTMVLAVQSQSWTTLILLPPPYKAQTLLGKAVPGKGVGVAEQPAQPIGFFRRGMSFQVWGPGKQQFPGDDGHPALLEHMAPTSVLTIQQEEGQGIPPENHQNH